MSALGAELIRLIRSEGPLPVSRYMALCLGHPRHGYYMTRDPFGAQGDFTTAPEISQMFGELIGIWAAGVWQAMGAPAAFRLVELGPGRGTLMADMLRAMTVLPAFRAAAAVHLVETSPVLRELQARTLAGAASPVWHDTIASALDGPVIVVANEFLDALPLDQFVMTDEGWRERLVGLDSDGGLAFGLAGLAQRAPSPAAGEVWSEGRGKDRGEETRDEGRTSDHPQLGDAARLDPPSGAARRRLPQGEQASAPGGAVFEHPRAALDIVSTIARHIASAGGAALFIDYGSAQSGFGDTLQAMKGHAFVDPLTEPGEADLTVHVDFARMAAAGLRSGAAAHGPASQRDFLLALGLAARAQSLASRATHAQAATLQEAFDRLTAPGATGMGDLFKALAFSHPGLPSLPGFDLHRLPEQV